MISKSSKSFKTVSNLKKKNIKATIKYSMKYRCKFLTVTLPSSFARLVVARWTVAPKEAVDKSRLQDPLEDVWVCTGMYYMYYLIIHTP